MLGWVFHGLKLRNQEFFMEQKALREVRENVRIMSAITGKRVGIRPYPLVKQRSRGRFVTVSLANGLLRLIQRYAIATGRSRNDTLVLFLQDGLKVYSDSKTSFFLLGEEPKNPMPESSQSKEVPQKRMMREGSIDWIIYGPPMKDKGKGVHVTKVVDDGTDTKPAYGGGCRSFQ
jgi:hypothetical protein